MVWDSSCVSLNDTMQRGATLPPESTLENMDTFFSQEHFILLLSRDIIHLISKYPSSCCYIFHFSPAFPFISMIFLDTVRYSLSFFFEIKSSSYKNETLFFPLFLVCLTIFYIRAVQLSVRSFFGIFAKKECGRLQWKQTVREKTSWSILVT